jgi:beta-glucosidase
MMRVAAALAAALCGGAPAIAASIPQPIIGTRSISVLTTDGLRFRDLNRNRRLDPYEDWRLSPETRALDLVGRMTLPERAGAMMHGTAPFPGGARSGTIYDRAAARKMVLGAHVTSMITRLAIAPRLFAQENNALQAIAEQGRLGIPLTLSTDPRNHFQYTAGASVSSAGFSQWPEALGFAAIGDAAVVRRFGDIVRQEYRAVGIHQALSPQADLATEPRWGRIVGTFGEDAELAGRMVGAYVEGFQGGAEGLRPDGVATVVKHWVGYGAAKGGWDSHSHYGRFATFPGNNFANHVEPFLPAFRSRVAGVMPTYSILENLAVDGHPVEQVGAGFNAWLLTDQLRGRYGFGGIILSDWLVTSDCPKACVEGSDPGQPPVLGMPWGVEALTRQQRFVKGVRAGIDQFGGVDETDLIVAAVEAGDLDAERVAQSARRVMTMKFAQGLFENPFVDAANADRIVGNRAFQDAADAAQRRSLVLLQNRDAILPLQGARKVYLQGISADAARARGLVPVGRLDQADVALVRAVTPWEMLHPRHLFGQLQHEGSLAFTAGQKEHDDIVRIARTVPTIVTVFLDRPAILTELQPHVRAIIGNFGVGDGALLDVVTGRAAPAGKLPFELPSSMEEVAAQRPDVPHDTASPSYPFGFGLRY